MLLIGSNLSAPFFFFGANSSPPTLPQFSGVTNLVYLDALSPPEQLTLAGSNVTAWAGKGATGINYDQTDGARQPSTLLVNGRRMIDFDDANTEFLDRNTNGQAYFGARTVYTLFIVLRANISVAAGAIIGEREQGFGWQFQIRQQSNSQLNIFYQNDAATVVLNASTASGFLTGNTQIISVTDNGSNVTVRSNKAAAAINQPYVRANFPFTADASRSGIGVLRSPTNIQAPFTGQIGAIVAYNAALSDTQRNEVVDFLAGATQWGISV